MKGKIIMTVSEMQDRAKWLALRNKGIGGSDIAVIVGMNNWKSPFQLWAEKTGETAQEDLSDNEFIYWGNVLEEAVANRFCELTGKTVRRCGMLQDEVVPYFLANVDRLVVGEQAGLEIKTTSSFKRKEWDEDKLPDSYYLQCQWYMGITGFPKWYIAVLIGGNKFIWKEIPRNEDDIAAIRQAGMEFWDKVQTHTMPELDGSDSCGKILSEKFNRVEDNTVMLPSIASQYITRIDELDATEKVVSAEKEKLKNELKLLLGNAEHGVIGSRKVNWTAVAGRTSIDSKALKKDLPDVYSRYAKTGKPSRKFTIS